MKLKTVIFVLTAVLLLGGCTSGRIETWETVGDYSDSVACMGAAPYEITVSVPEDFQPEVDNPARNGHVYYRDDGAYVETKILRAESADSAIHQLTGYNREELEVMETTRFGLPEYRFAWYIRKNGQGYLCRGELIEDTSLYYAVTVAAAEENARCCSKLAGEIFPTMGLFTDEGF